MLNRFLFAGALGALFSVIAMLFVDQPYAMYVSFPVAIVLGWFSNDIYALIFGDK
jgi:hypothetical protein